MVGLAFKLSAVPFHFWCPDAFEGAPAEVGGFLSVVSKAAALALLVRVAIGFGHVPEERGPLAADSAVQESQLHDQGVGAIAPLSSSTTSLATSTEAVNTETSTPPRETRNEALEPVRHYMAMLIGVLAMLTCTFGNLAAYAQTNLKRLLAYSTIAHAGYMMMPVAAALVLLNQGDLSLANDALASLVVYITIYMFMNFAAFAIVAFLRNATFSEEIDYYGGLYKTAPGVVICLGVVFFSLLGMPPLAGFVAKFAIFVSLVEAGEPLTITMLVVAGLNTAISLYYYLRVIKVMAIDPEPEDRPPIQMSLFPSIPGSYVLMLTLPVLIFGIWPEPLFRLAAAATKNLLW
jgi:NADH-quinone oxidoreductase subunit N